MTRVRPWRGPGPGRPAVPLPPARMRPVRGGRPLKAWTYVGAFGPELMLCAASVRIGIVRVSWWAVWDRERRRLVQRTARGRGGVEVSARRLAVAGRAARLELLLGDGEPVEVVSPHGDQYAWTRKRGGVPARGWVELGGARRRVELRAIVDESAGYHARRTAWRWSAGVGVAAAGEPVAWNLVDGIHDAAEASERTVWVAGRPHEVGPVRFGAVGADLATIAFAEGGGLRFAAEAVRARRENLLVVRSDYEQPFGTFSGAPPVAGPLREGWGVMERHDVRW
jgi:uncharacterized protein DUF2804